MMCRVSEDVLSGQSFPLGATVQNGGVNFCVFSRNARAVELLLFDHAEDALPARAITLDSTCHRTFYYWHAFVPGLEPGQLYGYRVQGPFQPEKGLCFDGQKLLLDPYTRCVAYGENYDRQAARRPGDNCAYAMKSVIADIQRYDWEGDTPLRRPVARSVVYEMHVGGFTRHPNSGLPSDLRGTYAGLIHKIPYLCSLGVTAVELLPVQQFDEQETPSGLNNYWGYNPIAFFAPHRGYCSCSEPLKPLEEFRQMVKALHRADIEVILDVVFNHTAESGADGPTLSFRGLENRAYYILDRQSQYRYIDYTGCGNAINANQSIVRRLILDCLHYWVQEMHVDGFRFDLASVMARNEEGVPLKDPPVLWEIESDPILAGTRIIAEAWDAAGLYQVGSFIGHRWAEWNGRFRDDVRRFIKGDGNTVENLSERIAGSRDLYPQPDREPNRSVNFVTCHDGFTLNDLVSFNQKHNWANLEKNRDGTSWNDSWNCGVEGPTHAASIEALRQQQIRNFLTVLFVSQGTPMLTMGDEVRRTQQGNNNAYCQDNPVSWFDWEAVAREAGLLRFVQHLIACRQQCALFHQRTFWTEPGGPEVVWHGVHLNCPDRSASSHSLAFELYDPDCSDHVHVILNAYWEPLQFELPPLAKGWQWYLMVNTALPSPEDFSDPLVPLPACSTHFTAQPRSTVILKAGAFLEYTR